jgi:hypothetical protein
MSQRSTLHVDCDDCSARGPACTDCVVSVLLGMPGPRVDLDDDEQQALSALAGSGLVPPLRLMPLTVVESAPVPPGTAPDPGQEGRRPRRAG